MKMSSGQSLRRKRHRVGRHTVKSKKVAEVEKKKKIADRKR
jgi:hypothetical protein